VKFVKKDEWFRFRDGQRNLIERKTEVRVDPLTGETSRIIFDPGIKFTPPDFTRAAEETGGAKCPFCPENLYKMTPVFQEEIAEQGRIIQGEAVVFPNLFPYSKHNGVVVLSKKHYLRLEEMTVPLIKDGLAAAQAYVQRIVETDKDVRYASINWNYLPYSGGSILHPHLQVAASDSPTNYQALINEKIKGFNSEKDYFTDLYEKEKSLGERWIGEIGNAAWMHAYSPKGQNDFLAIFPEKYSLDDIEEQDWIHFAQGQQAVFAALADQGFVSFNMMLTVPTEANTKQSIHVRLIPRFTIGMMETSDINYFQALHQEPLTYKIPEEVAEKAREHFSNL
jgi:UDPglucose--hexose-1-phosphate uridylyltransferase